ncbi:alpha/beta fold hydrolase [Cellulomonas marina]|uniref:alpha/beta fold hydrolase n=1 Tax=Cellulomonas marina TaxID=988821 RepID=UPI001587B5DC|nr:alpha/beta hydrolase [Cellulomonas marina]
MRSRAGGRASEAASGAAWGSGADEGRHDVVLVHGLGVDGLYFERLTRRLTGLGTVHRVDLPGFAGLPRPDREPVEVVDHAELLLHWLDRARPVRPVLLGHSLGTQVVVEALARRPDAATHAVLVGPTVSPDGRTAHQQVGRLLRSAVFESPGTQALVVRGYARCGVPWAVRQLRAMLRHPTEDRIGRVAVPVLVVRGTHDRVAPRGWVQDLADAAPRGAVAEVAGASHAVVHDHAEELAALVREHVRR